MDNFVHGLFKDEESAARAVQTLVDANFNPDLIGALMHLEGDVEVQDAVPIFKVASARGATLGSALGMIGGALLAVGGLLGGGPLLAAAAGGATGALAGMLGGLGRWKDEIDFPQDVHAGMILVGVSTEEACIERARVALAIAHPERIHVSRKNEACTEVETGVLSETGVLAGQSR